VSAPVSDPRQPGLVRPLLEARRLGQQLARLLACEIVSGRMAPGQGFPSADELVTRYGVSRTVARETVQTLSLLGLVRVQHGKRTEILPPEEWDVLSAVVQDALRREGRASDFVRDVYVFRLLVEPKAAALVAARGAPDVAAELDRLVQVMESRPGGDGDVIMAADRDFHDAIARASGNRIIAAVSRDIREVLRTLWELSRPGADERRRMAEQHRRIVDAIADRDEEGAAAAMQEHLQWATDADIGRLQHT
jgi:GntR family galactonate operon transcriptional repressor